MNSPNTQKIVTSFLILAALTSSSVFLLSNLQVDTSGAPANTAKQMVLDGKNAFVETPSSLPSYNSPLSARSNMGSSPYATITDNFTDQLVQKLMAANPTGPDLSKANPLVVPKDFGDLGGIQGLVMPNFLPQIQDKKIRTTSKYTAEDILTYLTSSQSAITDILAPGLAQLNNQSLSLQSLGDISEIYDRAENKLYQTPVPAPLTGFNRALLGLINVQRTFFDQTDPAKTLIALQNPKMVLTPYQQAVTIEANKLRNTLPKLLGSLDQEGKTQNVLAALFTVQTAYAFDFIGGISGIISAVLDVLGMVLQQLISQLTNVEFYKKILTEYLKNVLVKRLVAQTTQWIQGGGEPQYVQNWQQFLGDSFSTAVSGVISKYAPGLCSSFRPLVQVALTPVQVDYSALNNPYSCTPERIAGNFEDLQRSFEDGGWITYGYMLQPNNNIYGSIVQLSATANQTGNQAQAASQNSANAASGFLSTKECKDKVTVTPADVGGGISSKSDARAAFGDNFISCSDAKCSSITLCNPNNPNAWQETTPGKLLSDTLSKNLGGSSLERVVNAQDLVGLFNAVVNAGLSKLIDLGKKGLSSLTADKLANDNLTPADACKNLTGDALAQCQTDNSNASSTASSASTKEIPITKMQSILKFKNQLLEEESGKVVPLITQTLAALDTASSTCSTVLNAASSTLDAANTLSFIDQTRSQLEEKLLDATTTLLKLTGPTPPDPTVPGQLADLSELINRLKSDDLAYVATFLGLTAPPAGDDTAKEQFFNRLSLAMDDPGSTFANLFSVPPNFSGTLNDSSQAVGAVQIYETTLTTPAGSCGLLEKAQRLTTLKVKDQNDNDVSACSIAIVQASCSPAAPR